MKIKEKGNLCLVDPIDIGDHSESFLRQYL